MREVDAALHEHISQFAKLMEAQARPRKLRYSSLYDFFIKEGRLMNPEPYTPDEEEELKEIFRYIGRKAEVKQCFYNSQSLALDGGIGYAEGQILIPELPIPLEHGFNFLPSGKVVDITVRPRGEKDTCSVKKLLERARLNQKNAYFGVPFPATLIRRTWFDTEQAIMLLGYPPIQEIIFEKGFPQEWKEAPFWNFPAEPSPGALSGTSRRPSREFVAEPSPLEECGLLEGGPSWEFAAEPSRSEFRGTRRWSSRGNRAEPSLPGVSGILEGSSRDFIAEPSPSGFPALAGPRPEEEWLNEQEREGYPPDETRSPHEGDIPPWGQRGYSPVFPMARKIFYVTAYLGSGPENLSRSPAPATSPVLGQAFQVMNVGTLPGGNFGSDFMYYPFAAVPIRYEDREEITPLVDYLVALIGELGVYGKILLEQSFPVGREVRLVGGRWFPVEPAPRDYGGIDFLNAYVINRLYGGPQEGGWWFDTGSPIASIPIRSEDPAAMIEWKDYLEKKISWTSQHDRFSVLGHDDYGIRVEDFFAREFPEETPRYE